MVLRPYNETDLEALKYYLDACTGISEANVADIVAAVREDAEKFFKGSPAQLTTGDFLAALHRWREKK